MKERLSACIRVEVEKLMPSVVDALVDRIATAVRDRLMSALAGEPAPASRRRSPASQAFDAARSASSVTSPEAPGLARRRSPASQAFVELELELVTCARAGEGGCAGEAADGLCETHRRVAAVVAPPVS